MKLIFVTFLALFAITQCRAASIGESVAPVEAENLESVNFDVGADDDTESVRKARTFGGGFGGGCCGGGYGGFRPGFGGGYGGFRPGFGGGYGGYRPGFGGGGYGRRPGYGRGGFGGASASASASASSSGGFFG